MYQVAAPIWNQIAATQKLRSSEWAPLLRMNEQEQSQALDKLTKELEKQGLDSQVILSYLTTAPLLYETKAISRWIQQRGDNSFRTCLPELTTVSEAIRLATMEYNLTKAQATQLTALLKQHAPSLNA